METKIYTKKREAQEILSKKFFSLFFHLFISIKGNWLYKVKIIAMYYEVYHICRSEIYVSQK